MVFLTTEKMPELNENNLLTSPREQSFYHVFLVFLQILGFGRGAWWKMETKNKYVAFIYKLAEYIIYLAPICFGTQILYIYSHFHDMEFETMGVIYAITFIALTINIKWACREKQSYKRTMKGFLDELHVYNCHIKEPSNNFIRQRMIRVERLSRMTFLFIFLCLFVDWVAWTLIPFVHYLQNADLVREKKVKLLTCLYFWTPFDYTYNVRNWIIMHTVDSLLCLLADILTTVFESFTFFCIYHLIAHLEIFKNNIEVVFSTKMTDRQIEEELIKIIKNYGFITHHVSEFQSAFGLNITAVYFQNLFVDSVLLYQLMIGGVKGFFIHGLMLVVYMGGLILMSFILEEIRRQSDDIPDIIYSLPWEDMSPKNKQLLLMILVKVQPTMIFKSAGGLRTGVQPMISILKSTFSYYVMLKSSL